MRELSRPISTVAGLGFLSQFPYGHLRRVPIPGVDVALGVTSYQIAEIARLATVATQYGRRTTAKFARALEDGLNGIWGAAEDARKNYGLEVAKQAARGSIHAIDKLAKADVGQLAHQAVLGVTRALRHSRVDSKDALRGAGYGVVQGADEIHADLGEAALQAVEAAKELAAETGLSEEAAVAEIAKGALEAAEALGADAVEQLKTIFPEQISDTVLTEEEKGIASDQSDKD